VVMAEAHRLGSRVVARAARTAAATALWDRPWISASSGRGYLRVDRHLVDLSSFLDEALRDLSPPGMQIAVAIVPRQPGLYAINADADVWEELGLALPPDPRPLYAGKAERSLAGRDINTHFASGRTGSSTLRRALAGLLAQPLALRAQPRNPAKPAYFSNFGLEAEGDERLTTWMHHRLRIATWAAPPDVGLGELETVVLKTLQPPLNLDKVSTPWRGAVSAGRARLAAQARVWRPEQ
jgi:hypothetical protein